MFDFSVFSLALRKRERDSKGRNMRCISWNRQQKGAQYHNGPSYVYKANTQGFQHQFRVCNRYVQIKLSLSCFLSAF